MISRRLLPLLLLCATLAPALPAQAPAQTSAPASAQPAKSHRIVIALTSGDEADWKLLLGNLHNLLAGFAPDTAEVEIVAYGPGLNFEKKGSSAEHDIQSLESAHIRFVACENSMRAQKVVLADLVAGVTSVPSGIVEVVTRQEQGWTYIKAGR